MHVQIDVDTVDPNHLEELAHLIRNNRLRQREIAVAHASELLERPTIGWWRNGRVGPLLLTVENVPQ